MSVQKCLLIFSKITFEMLPETLLYLLLLIFFTGTNYHGLTCLKLVK